MKTGANKEKRKRGRERGDKLEQREGDRQKVCV